VTRASWVAPQPTIPRLPDQKPPRFGGGERGETARHAGHADILRELIVGQTGR